jgi:hypothetical protein
LSKVFVQMGISLDGFVAGVNRGPKNPLGHLGIKMHEWQFHQRAFRENLKLGEGGETGPDDPLASKFRHLVHAINHGAAARPQRTAGTPAGIAVDAGQKRGRP